LSREINRISPEAPVPVFLKESEKSYLGGAAKHNCKDTFFSKKSPANTEDGC
jgi:bifunctional ADP-heptose synthase (sugar kinase/adenylyltransferase)